MVLLLMAPRLLQLLLRLQLLLQLVPWVLPGVLLPTPAVAA